MEFSLFFHFWWLDVMFYPRGGLPARAIFGAVRRWATVLIAAGLWLRLECVRPAH